MDPDVGAGEGPPLANAKSWDRSRLEVILRRSMMASILCAIILMLILLVEFTKMSLALKAVTSLIVGINKLTYMSTDGSAGSE